MKVSLKLSLFLLALVLFADKSYSLYDYQIKKICKKEQKTSICIKNLRDKRDNLKKGNAIEIPVIPYKR